MLSRAKSYATSRAKKAAHRPCLARLRPPASYVIFNVTFRIARPCSNYQTGAPFPVPAAPLHASIEHHHPIQRFPDLKRSRCFLLRLRPVFSLPACVCICAEVCRCTFGLFAESPRSARLSRMSGNYLLNSNPHARKSAKVKALGNGLCGKCLNRSAFAG